MNYFTVREIRPGLLHIGEASGVHCTLVLGRSKALLFDTGYGICDICQYVRALTSLPLTVVNSHCHLDHSGGNHFFPEVLANPSEQEIYADYQRKSRAC